MIAIPTFSRSLSRALLVALVLLALPACGGTTTQASRGTTPSTAANSTHPPTLSFEGRTFFLAYEANSETGSIAEYIPRGQRPDAWTELVAVRRFYRNERPIDLAGAMHATLQGRTPPRPSRLFVNEEDGHVLLEFIDFEGEVFEPNFWRFESSASGVIGYQYARRAYGMEAAQALAQQVQTTGRDISASVTAATFPLPASPSEERFERYFTVDGTAASEVLAP